MLGLNLPSGAEGNITAQLPKSLNDINTFSSDAFFDKLSQLRTAWQAERDHYDWSLGTP